MRGAATENALSPIFRFARLTVRLLLPYARNDCRDGSLAAGRNCTSLPPMASRL